MEHSSESTASAARMLSALPDEAGFGASLMHEDSERSWSSLKQALEASEPQSTVRVRSVSGASSARRGHSARAVSPARGIRRVYGWLGLGVRDGHLLSAVSVSAVTAAAMLGGAARGLVDDGSWLASYATEYGTSREQVYQIAQALWSIGAATVFCLSVGMVVAATSARSRARGR